MADSETYAGQDSEIINHDEVYEVLLNACSHIVGAREKRRLSSATRKIEPLPTIVKDLLEKLFKETKDIRAANMLAVSGVEVYIKGVRWKPYSATIEQTEPTGALFFRDNLDGLLDEDSMPVTIRPEFYADHGRPDESDQ